MSDFDIEAVRAQVRAMDFVRGTPAEIAMWREDMAESRANLVIEDMIPTPNDDAFFAMMLDEGMPPPLVTQILHRLYDHPEADLTLAITPMTVAGARPWKSPSSRHGIGVGTGQEDKPMRSINPLFEDAVIDCVATDRQPSVQELFRIAERIWSDGAADRSAFRWNSLAPTDIEKLLALRAAQAALSGSMRQAE